MKWLNTKLEGENEFLLVTSLFPFSAPTDSKQHDAREKSNNPVRMIFLAQFYKRPGNSIASLYKPDRTWPVVSTQKINPGVSTLLCDLQGFFRNQKNTMSVPQD